MEEISAQVQNLFKSFSRDRMRKRQMRVIDAYDHCVDEEIEELIDMNEVRDQAIEAVEENGIVFIDEIDKIAEAGEGGRDVSRHGVQRDLLPLVEGTSVNTRYGNVHTDHILFIAGGAFHYSRPSDLIPELQGRFPLRVELSPLTVDDFKRILTGTRACLTKQYQALLKTERVALSFTDDGVDEIAETAWRINEKGENIGARRLYAVMEKVLEDCSYNADQLRGQSVVVDRAMVQKALAGLADNSERARYIL
jgi:ATP-dependent HslUV protease ATP-binding subunit HslU